MKPIEPPRLGRWISGNGNPAVTVAEVAFSDDDPGFFLVTVEPDGDLLDGIELDPQEWLDFVADMALNPA